MMLSDSGPRKKARIASVTLLKPPPEQKPPEPKVQQELPKQQQVVEQIAQPQAGPQNDQPPDTGQSGPLGVEGDGSAGGDSFGLAARGKGGRSLIGGGTGGMSKLSLLAKYGFYTSKIEDEVRRHVKKKLEQAGGLPKGKMQTTVKIVLNANGTIAEYRIVGSSGNSTMDSAVKEALNVVRISEPPPEGMPRGMTIRISS
jgi:TonB family protein